MPAGELVTLPLPLITTVIVHAPGLVGVGVGVDIAEKLADSVIGPFMVTDDGFALPVYEPDPLPAQLWKANPVLGIA
jgi:hypothetical protein